MARKEAIPVNHPVQLSTAQMQAAITKLKRRITDVESFNCEEAAQSDGYSADDIIIQKIDETLIDIFGYESLEYKRYQIGSLYHSDGIMVMAYGGPRHHEKLKKWKKGKKKALDILNNVISTLEEKLMDAGLPSGGGRSFNLDSCDLEPALTAACSKLYKDAHFSQAIENACKVLNAKVKEKSGFYDKENTDLMQHVFSKNKPLLRFNELKNEYDLNEQQGFMFLYTGVFFAFRNQRAHKILEDEAYTAFSLINFIDFLIKNLDNATLDLV